MDRRREIGAGCAALFVLSSCHLLEPRSSEPAAAPTSASTTTMTAIELPPVEDAGSEPPRASTEPTEPGVVQGGTAPTRGVLPKAKVDAAMQPALPAFRACYERALSAKPTLRGKLLVQFVVAPDGSVPYAAAVDAGTDLEDAAVIDCVLAEVSKLVFPEPTGGRSLVNYPLEFSPSLDR